MLRAAVARLWQLIGEANAYLPRPPVDTAQRRRQAIGKRPGRPRKAGRLAVPRPRTRREEPPTVAQHALTQVQQARRAKDVAGMRFWNLKFAKHARSQ